MAAGRRSAPQFIFFVVALLLINHHHTEVVGKTEKNQVSSKLSGIIIPGFASTQLRAWSVLDCPYSPLDFNPLDSVWLDTTKVLSAVNCWLKCMMLDPYNQTDHPECKSRPDSGLSAITELDPGYITGPLSSVWKDWVRWCIEFGIEANAIVAAPYDWRLSPSVLEERDLYFHKLKPSGPLSSVWKDWVRWCIEFGIEANAIVAAPYDWRLSPSVLEERDLYFHKLKLIFETTLKLRGSPSLVFAHSLGNNVFRYFLEWLKLEIAPKHYVQWLDNHIYAYFAVGSPLLGATEAVKATFSGVLFGLPIAEGTSRLLYNSFGSTLWFMPFSKHCKADDVFWKNFVEGKGNSNHSHTCDKREFTSNYSGWPTDIVNIEIPFKGVNSYPSIEDISGITSNMECGRPVLLSFSAREVSDGTLFKAIKDYDPDSKRLLYQLQKYYQGDPVLNPLTPWDRPPIKNIFCIYGIDLKTEVGYYFAPSGKPYPDNWMISDIIYEYEGSLFSRSGNSVNGNPGAASGDETVSYNSLSWCKTWLGPKVNITRAPQSEHDGSDVQIELNAEHENDKDIVPNMTRASRVKYITYYEDAESRPGRKTAVWELDKANHRNIVRMQVLMRELWLQMWHDIHPNMQSSFVTKAVRGPLRDVDCYWDYGKARCSWPEHCEYRYVFGDVHLGQSCRLRNSSTDLLQHYL